MELEQRIRSLELEMKILKNEVQRTLIYVQEQVLLDQRPVLTIESKPSNAKVRAIEPLRAQQPAVSAVLAAAVAPAAPAVSVAPAASVAPTAPAVLPTPIASVAPPVAPTAPAAAPVLNKVSVAPVVPGAPLLKQVSLEEIRAAQSELEAEAMPANSIVVDKLVEMVQKPDSGPGERSNGDAAALAERGGVKLLEWLMSSATKVDGERDEKQVNEVLDKLSQLNSLVDRASTMEEALRLIEEANLG